MQDLLYPAFKPFSCPRDRCPTEKNSPFDRFIAIFQVLFPRSPYYGRSFPEGTINAPTPMSRASRSSVKPTAGIKSGVRSMGESTYSRAKRKTTPLMGSPPPSRLLSMDFFHDKQSQLYGNGNSRLENPLNKLCVHGVPSLFLK